MKKLVETMYNGEFMDENEDEAKVHFEWLVEHASEWEPKEPSRSRAKSITQLRSKDNILKNHTTLLIYYSLICKIDF